MKTLRELLYSHNNNYKLYPAKSLPKKTGKRHNGLSVVIPYYRTGELFKKTLHHLYNSLSLAKAHKLVSNYEVIIVDDASLDRKPSNNAIRKYPNARVIRHKSRQGRSITRNTGLYSSKFNTVLFLDSDVLLDNMQITNHLLTHAACVNKTRKECIAVSFFQFTDMHSKVMHQKQLAPNDIKINDYRNHCVFGKTWYGCEEDKQYIGKEYRIIEDTNHFKDWHGMYGPWALSNMVLGGCFSVNRKAATEVGGFNECIKSYCFDETTLATKLIAIKKHYVIPILSGGGIHVEDVKINYTRRQKNYYFRKQYAFYFNRYLNLTTKQAINNEIEAS